MVVKGEKVHMALQVYETRRNRREENVAATFALFIVSYVSYLKLVVEQS